MTIDPIDLWKRAKPSVRRAYRLVRDLNGDAAVPADPHRTLDAVKSWISEAYTALSEARSSADSSARWRADQVDETSPSAVLDQLASFIQEIDDGQPTVE